jgi:hypothetical protein
LRILETMVDRKYPISMSIYLADASLAE